MNASGDAVTPLEALVQRLADLRPRELLYVSARPALAPDLLPVTVRSDIRDAADLAGEGRHDCVLVADFLEHLPKANGLAVLGRLRNLHAGQVLVFIDHGACRDAWSLDDLLGMGFRVDARCSDGSRTLTLYSYDIATYNHEREWNNPRFWANPDLWGKYFW